MPRALFRGGRNELGSWSKPGIEKRSGADLVVLEIVLGMTLNCLAYSWGVKPVALRGAQV